MDISQKGGYYICFNDVIKVENALLLLLLHVDINREKGVPYVLLMLSNLRIELLLVSSYEVIKKIIARSMVVVIAMLLLLLLLTMIMKMKMKMTTTMPTMMMISLDKATKRFPLSDTYFPTLVEHKQRYIYM